MDINLRSVAAVTYLGGDLTFLDHLLNFHTKVRQEVKKEDCIGHAQKRWALHYVVIKINDGVQFYLMAMVLAVKTFNRPNNRLYANSNGYDIRNNKGDQVSSTRKKC